MSYDLEVYTAQGLEAAALREMLAASGLGIDESQSSQDLLHVVRGARRNYAFTLAAAAPLEPEDLPEVLGEAAHGLRWLHGISVEGSSPTSIPYAVRFARQIARTCAGVVVDQQVDSLWGKGAPRELTRVEAGLIDIVELTWYARANGSGAMAAHAWLELSARHLPEAFPRRFGKYEPFTMRTDREGVDAFVAAVEGASSSAYFTTAAPSMSGGLAGGGASAGFRAHQFTIHRAVLNDPTVRAGLKRLFTEFALATHAVYASAEVSRDWNWTGRSLGAGPEAEFSVFLAGLGEWAGLPPYPVWWSLFGPDYAPFVETHLRMGLTERRGHALFFAHGELPLDSDQLAALYAADRHRTGWGRLVADRLRGPARPSDTPPWLPAELLPEVAPRERGASDPVESPAALIPPALQRERGEP